MSLGVLFPAALALGVLALGPVLAHLARQEPGTRQPFGAMLLLDRLLKRIQRRRRWIRFSSRSRRSIAPNG